MRIIECLRNLTNSLTKEIVFMSVKSDSWIRKMAKDHRMIEPFEPVQVKKKGKEQFKLWL